jgi:hypothetical protein
MIRILTIKSKFVFDTEESWARYKAALIGQLGSEVKFDDLEKKGTFRIKSGAQDEGSAESLYKLETKR